MLTNAGNPSFHVTAKISDLHSNTWLAYWIFHEHFNIFKLRRYGHLKIFSVAIKAKKKQHILC